MEKSEKRDASSMLRIHLLKGRFCWSKLLCSLLASACLLILCGCAGSIKNLPVNRGEPCPIVDEANRTKLHVEYLGTGGYLFRYGTNELLTDPYFSNHSIWDLAVTTLPPKKEIVDRLIPNLDAVNAVLIGHAHHDHLADLSYVLNSTGCRVPVYGNKTMVNVLTNCVANKLFDLEPMAGTFDTNRSEGKWQYTENQMIRFMALKSMHAPQLGKHLIGRGNILVPQTDCRLHFLQWKTGQPLAYIIDFLKENGSIAYRVVYQDTAVDGETYGLLPLTDSREPDLAILCLASFHNVEGYPDKYLGHLGPKQVLIGHWEDFFRSPLKPLKSVRGTDAEAFIKTLPCKYRGSSILPRPGKCFHFEIK